MRPSNIAMFAYINSERPKAKKIQTNSITTSVVFCGVSSQSFMVFWATIFLLMFPLASYTSWACSVWAVHPRSSAPTTPYRAACPSAQPPLPASQLEARLGAEVVIQPEEIDRAAREYVRSIERIRSPIPFPQSRRTVEPPSKSRAINHRISN